MPKDPRIKKVLVIGSGPIIIGQAAEFDYSGTQACRALKAEGIETVLLNSNPATIMTDPDVADHVYIEPMTLEVVERILDIEKPDSVLPNLGGQMGLNLSMELARSGYLDRTGIRLLACKPETIDRAEDRELFKETMEKLHQPIIPCQIFLFYRTITDDDYLIQLFRVIFQLNGKVRLILVYSQFLRHVSYKRNSNRFSFRNLKTKITIQISHRTGRHSYHLNAGSGQRFF